MMLPRFLLAPVVIALSGCATMHAAPLTRQQGFTAQQEAALRENGFVQKGDGWEFGLADRMLFATNESELIPTQREALRHMAAALVGVGIVGSRVEGHTDVTGTAGYNEALSLRRARSVADALSDGGMSRDLLVVRGLGKANPARSNTTATGRRENRRVVIIVSAPSVEAPAT